MLARDRSAATAVEVALLFPVFLLLLLGISEFGRALWTQTALQFAVGAAARCAAVNPSQCSDVRAYAATQAYGLSIPSGDFVYTANASCGISGYDRGAQVTVSYPFRPLVPQLVPLSVTLSAQSCHP
jgi:Flp pilus assembly protein TadG